MRKTSSLHGLLTHTLLRVLPVATLVMLLIGFSGSKVLENTFLTHSRAQIEQDARFSADAIASKLQALLGTIRSVAANDLMINGLVDKDARETYIPLYFKQMDVAGLQAGGRISFVDFRGQIIASNDVGEDYIDAVWLETVIIKGEEFIRFDKAGALLIVPVRYLGSSQGAIVAEFSKHELAKILSHSAGARAVTVYSGDNELYSSDTDYPASLEAGPEATAEWIRFSAPLPSIYGLSVTVAERKDVAFAFARKLEGYLGLALLLALLALTAGIALTAVMTTRPVARFASELKGFGEAMDLSRRVQTDGATEFHDLSNAFNAMLDRLQKTVVSNEALSREVDMRKRAQEVRRKAREEVRTKETALKEQVKQFNIALENMSQGLCVFDNEQRVVVCNELYARMYGLTPEEVKPGTALEQIIRWRIDRGVYAGESPDAYETERFEWAEQSSRKKTIVKELSNGRVVRIVRTPLSDGAWVATHDDITESKRVDRLKDEFISIVSHELRTPLTSLIGSLGLVGSGSLGDLPAKAKSLLDIAHRNAERLTMLVNDIVDVQRIKCDQMRFNFAPNDMVALAGRAIDENAAFSAKYGVNLKLEEKLGSVYADADENRILQVLTNLLANAVKFSPSGADVVLSVSREGGLVRLAVADNGPGISSDMQDGVFDRFIQVDGSDSRVQQGTGLGLSIAQAIVEKHGGKIKIRSKPGAGTVFYFDLSERSKVVTNSPLDVVFADEIAMNEG